MAFKKDSKVKNNFTKITIGLASPEEILENSYGEVTKPETINYRTSLSAMVFSASASLVLHETMNVPAENISAFAIKVSSVIDVV